MDELEQLRAFTLGMQNAFMSVVTALIRTHPDPEGLKTMLELYRQRELAYLENSAFPERVLDSFYATWKRFEFELPNLQVPRLGPQQPPAQA